MKIKYTFVTGETIEVEVDYNFGAEIRCIEHREELKDRAETRRHISIESVYEKAGDVFEDQSVDPDQFISSLDVLSAINTLLPSQQALVRQIYFEGRSIKEIADIDVVSESAIRNRLKKINNQLKKYL